MPLVNKLQLMSAVQRARRRLVSIGETTLSVQNK